MPFYHSTPLRSKVWRSASTELWQIEYQTLTPWVPKIGSEGFLTIGCLDIPWQQLVQFRQQIWSDSADENASPWEQLTIVFPRICVHVSLRGQLAISSAEQFIEGSTSCYPHVACPDMSMVIIDFNSMDLAHTVTSFTWPQARYRIVPFRGLRHYLQGDNKFESLQ